MHQVIIRVVNFLFLVAWRAVREFCKTRRYFASTQTRWQRSGTRGAWSCQPTLWWYRDRKEAESEACHRGKGFVLAPYSLSPPTFILATASTTTSVYYAYMFFFLLSLSLFYPKRLRKIERSGLLSGRERTNGEKVWKTRWRMRVPWSHRVISVVNLQVSSKELRNEFVGKRVDRANVGVCVCVCIHIGSVSDSLDLLAPSSLVQTSCGFGFNSPETLLYIKYTPCSRLRILTAERYLGVGTDRNWYGKVERVSKTLIFFSLSKTIFEKN